LASITVERIAAVQAHINDAVVQTSARSTLSVQRQDELLAQGCAEACDLLELWLDSDWWTALRPADGSLVVECSASREDFEKFLDPMFRDAMDRAGRQGIAVPPELVDEARAAVVDIGRRHRKMSRSDLFMLANNRVGDLKRAVCDLADDFRRGAQDAAKRRKAKAALIKVRNVLAHLAIVVATSGPHQVVSNLEGWAQTIMVTGVAQTAQPGLTIKPPGLGPTVR
jgi:hypothetical protein